VKIALESGAQIAWTGSVSLDPVRIEGDVQASGPLIALAHRYLRDRLRFDEAEGGFELRGHYLVEQAPRAGLSVALRDLGLRVADLRLSAESAPDFLAWKALDVSGVQIRWPQAEAELHAVRLDGLHVAARRDAQGTLDLATLLAPKSEPAATAAAPSASETLAPSASPAWIVRIGELALHGASAELGDASLTPPAQLSIAALEGSLRDIRNEPGAKIELDALARLGGGGVLHAKGELGVLPAVRVDAEVTADGVQLSQLQPYLRSIARIGIRGGALSIEGHLASDDAEPARFDGAVRVTDLDTRDLARDEKLIAWSELGLDDVQLRVGERSAQISRIRLVKPFGRIYVARDKTTNLGALLVEPSKPAATANGRPAREGEKSAATPSEPAQKPFRVRIGSVLVQSGEANYTDLSLPLPFAARVRDVNGRVTTIDTGSAAPTKLGFEGKVDPYGLARVQGMLRTNAPTELADVSVIFRNIEMPALSPYVVEFAGRKIARGKISVDLRYQLHDRKLEAQNKMVIDELELGDKVPSPNAIDLPLGLAVALLEDANGRIDLDLPVSGSLDDPQFRIGPVIWKAFVTLITKIATSPFRLLGSLLGVESDDFGKLEFEAGRSDVLPPDREKLARVVEALGKRPNLSVEVPAVVDPRADAAVLRRARVDSLVAQALSPGGKTPSGRDLEKRTRRVVEELYVRQLPDAPLEAQRARFVAVPPDDPKASPRLDEVAYVDDLRAQLAAAQEIADADLTALAQARAEAVAAVLRESGALDAARVKLGARRDVEARAGEWVGAELGVSN
jgi:hypothetical protein